MWTTQAHANTCKPTTNARRYIPRLERCEDRLPPGQVFALFADPLDAPLGVPPDVNEAGHETTSALVRARQPREATNGLPDADSGPALTTRREQLVLVQREAGTTANAAPADQADALTRAVAAWAVANVAQ